MTVERTPHQDTGWLIVHYVLAVTIIAVLLCFGQLLIQRELMLQSDCLQRTEAVHDQLLLSHRLSHSTPDLNARFQDNQAELALSMADDGEASAMLTRAQPQMTTMLEGLRSSQLNERQRLASELLRQSLESIVVHLNRSSQSRLYSLRWTELGILGLVLLTIVAESLLVFRPAAREIRGLFKELEETRLLLSRRLKRLNESHDSIKADLKSAAQVQRALLPREAPEVPGYSFAWSFRASHDVAGDMFNLIRLDESHVAVYVLDVSGHGVPAALLSVSISRVISANLGSLLKRRTTDAPFYQLTRPSEVARELNRRFPVMSESDQFFTFLYGIIDTVSETFTFVQAGHPGPIYMTDGNTRTFESPADPPIGIIDEVSYRDATIHLKAGDRVFIYTDGVIEARNGAGEMYELERVIETIQDHRGQSLSGCLEALYENMRHFTGGQPQRDDLTLVGFEVNPVVPLSADSQGEGNPELSDRDVASKSRLVTTSGRYRSIKP